MRRYYHVFEGVIHLLGIGILVFLLRAHDYVGQATFGGSPMSPQTVANLNANIHRGLLVVLIIAPSNSCGIRHNGCDPKPPRTSPAKWVMPHPERNRAVGTRTGQAVIAPRPATKPSN